MEKVVRMGSGRAATTRSPCNDLRLALALPGERKRLAALSRQRLEWGGRVEWCEGAGRLGWGFYSRGGTR
jgi:hypothetical protein